MAAISAAILLLVVMLNIGKLDIINELVVQNAAASETHPTYSAVTKPIASREDTPVMKKTDLIYHTRSAFVVPEYKLIFFTFPKVACSEWKRMFMRMNANPNWCKTRGFNAHDPKMNKIKTLGEFDVEIATAMMTSPAWTKAAILREPKERVLSAFLDKAVKEDYYVRKCCDRLPAEDLKQQCKKNEEDFASFLHFVTEYPEECFDVHWEPQIAKIDQKWFPYIDTIGYQHDLLNNAQALLKTLTSQRDDKPQRTAWRRYGMKGWGSENGCENRTRSFLEENTSSHQLNTGDHLKEWYTPETEKIVEEKWAIEWNQKEVNFPEIHLFNDE
eukprot:CAMPEP_0197249990 /NCGR_PEP_ID=MMETSP1429-20130617/50525_1 /TAXON_ID=49237 /ORGANISM="Chaetoceros  sp., Strain UNC1202" /LENGTH=329 /DNA_ID=CAMNT_0042711707 /DNA_START=70 /DNA_END=1059 /DNA_ORIENTATION=+